MTETRSPGDVTGLAIGMADVAAETVTKRNLDLKQARELLLSSICKLVAAYEHFDKTFRWALVNRLRRHVGKATPAEAPATAGAEIVPFKRPTRFDDAEVLLRRRFRLPCAICGADAVRRFTYLRQDAAGFEKSKNAYHSDLDIYACDLCKVDEVEGFHPHTMFRYGADTQFMFEAWQDTFADPLLLAAPAMYEAIKLALPAFANDTSTIAQRLRAAAAKAEGLLR
jgi:hypothetical protein